jgi:hypothetical protein
MNGNVESPHIEKRCKLGKFTREFGKLELFRTTILVYNFAETTRMQAAVFS